MEGIVEGIENMDFGCIVRFIFSFGLLVWERLGGGMAFFLDRIRI